MLIMTDKFKCLKPGEYIQITVSGGKFTINISLLQHVDVLYSNVGGVE